MFPLHILKKQSCSPETVAMVKLAVHEEPLHQVDVFVAGSAGAAQRAALDLCGRLRRPGRSRDKDEEETSGEGGKMDSNEGGGRSYTESGFSGSFILINWLHLLGHSNT